MKTWQQIDIPDICISLVQSAELKGFQADTATLIKLESHAADVTLDESFERVVHDIRNFVAISAPFANRFPELAQATMASLVLYKSLSASQVNDSSLTDHQRPQRNATSPLPRKTYPIEDPIQTAWNVLSEHFFEPAFDFPTAQPPQDVSTGFGDTFHKGLDQPDFSTFSNNVWLGSNAPTGHSDIDLTVQQCLGVDYAGLEHSCPASEDPDFALTSDVHSSNSGSNQFELEFTSAV